MFGTKILEEVNSKFNGNLRVVKSFGLGTYIQSDGLTQSGGVVETFWKQTLKKVQKTNPNFKNTLVLGLGGGTVTKLIRKIWPNAKITGVDIDPLIVELGRKYLDLEADKIYIKDANGFDTRGYDLVIVDLYQGDRFPEKFQKDKFLKSLSKNKLVIFNRLYYKDKKIEAQEFGEKLKKFFKKVEYFYPVTNLMFICSN
jgi:spermidine synthase